MAKKTPAQQDPNRKKKPLPKAAEPFRFKPGQSGNPEGARRHNPVLRAIRRITQESYAEVVELIMTGTVDELKEVLTDPKATAVQKLLARAFLEATEKGQMGTLERLLERLIGKVPDNINLVSKTIRPLSEKLTEADKGEVKKLLSEIEEDV